VSYILNIDTAVVAASVCISKNDEVLAFASNPEMKDHAAWLHPAIKDLLKKCGLSTGALDAIAVSIGPGSYTGLRVGLATAKGLCFALNKPLITINTLELMASAAKHLSTSAVCPMIDARRMEVFTALYTADGKMLMPPTNLVLEPSSFDTYLDAVTICFFGNGSSKFEKLVTHPNASFASIEASAAHMVPISKTAFHAGNFADLAYSEPFYGKEFYTTQQITAR
jgi:tRNA threonylcarbamoyladenosine biosynthesis protein TsaB